jgi:hypothetical protein
LSGQATERCRLQAVKASSSTTIKFAISREEWLCRCSGPRASENYQAEASRTQLGHGQTSSPVSLSSSYAWSCPPQLVPSRARRGRAVAFLGRSPLGGGNWGTSTGAPTTPAVQTSTSSSGCPVLVVVVVPRLQGSPTLPPPIDSGLQTTHPYVPQRTSPYEFKPQINLVWYKSVCHCLRTVASFVQAIFDSVLCPRISQNNRIHDHSGARIG